MGAPSDEKVTVGVAVDPSVKQRLEELADRICGGSMSRLLRMVLLPIAAADQPGMDHVWNVIRCLVGSRDDDDT